MNVTSQLAVANVRADFHQSKTEILARIFSFPMLLGALLVAAVFFGTLSQESKTDTLFSEGDTWWHIRAGEDILATRHLPQTDTYSWTASGTPWIAYEWLGEVAIAEAYRIGKLQGLRFLQLFLAGAMLTLLYAYASFRCGNPKAAFAACAVIVPVAAGFWSLRPQLFGFIFFVSVLLILEQFRRGTNRTLWVLPFLFFVWVNTHGTFVFGFLALAVTFLSGLRRWPLSGVESVVWTRTQRLKLELVTFASSLALFITPYQSQLAAYPVDIGFFQPANIANIQEWLPITSERFLTITVLVLLLGFLVSKIVLRFQCRNDDLAFVCIAAIAAFMHLRFVPLFLLVTVPLLAIPLASWFSPYKRSRDRAPLNGILVAVVLIALAYFFPSKKALEKTRAEHFPVEALRNVSSRHLRGHIFNDYGWGGYLAESRFPAEGVFIDGRADIYERTGVLEDYLSIARLEPNALQLLGKYGIGTCLLRNDAPLATVLSVLPDWRLIYRDSVTAVFIRSPKVLRDTPSPSPTF